MLKGHNLDRGDVVALRQNGSAWEFAGVIFDDSDPVNGFGTNVNIDAVQVVVQEPCTGLVLLIGIVMTGANWKWA